MASIDSFRPRRDSHNHQPRVKPTSLRVSLKTRTLICPTVNTHWCDWWPWKALCQTACCRDVFFFELASVIEQKGKYEREWRKAARWEQARKGRGGEAESGPLERRKRKTGVHFAQQMLKHLHCLLRASGSLHAGK